MLMYVLWKSLHCAQNIEKLTKTNTPTLTDICGKEVVHIRETDNAVPIRDRNIAIVLSCLDLQSLDAVQYISVNHS